MWGKVLCLKGKAKEDCHTGPIRKPWQAASFEPWQAVVEASSRQRHWVRRCPVKLWWLLHVLLQAAEDVSMAPALLELLLSHAGLPSPEPVAEHSCPEPDV